MNNKELATYLKEEMGELCGKQISLILTGSRAFGLQNKKSDYDCYIVYDKKIKHIIRKKFLKEKWMIKGGGIWTNIITEEDEQITVMSKSYDEVENEKEIAMQFVLRNAIVLFDKNQKYKKTIQRLKRKMNLEDELKRRYIETRLNLGLHAGMLSKEISQECVFFKKGDLIRNLMQLGILIDKKPYPYEKLLYWRFEKCKHFNKIKKMIMRIKKADTKKEAKALKKEIGAELDTIMPKKEYVGKNWWRYE